MLSRRFTIALLLALFFISVSSAYAQDASVTHVVQAGDNLYRIALKYGVSTDALAQTNNIADQTRIFVGQVLTIPGLTAVTANPTETINPLVSTTPVTHIVQRGEYIAQIARQYNVSVEQLLSANNISNPNLIYTGQVLQIWTNDLSVPISETPATVETVAPTPIPSASSPTTASTDTVIHVVQAGEYLSLIARNYGVSWTTIAEANGIVDPNNIYAGLQLRIPNPSSIPANAPITTISGDPGAHVGVGREVVVVLSTQMTYAYEDGVLVRSVQVSTGLPATPTVQGDYAIYAKYDAQLMAGPGYYLPDVPWIMYFYQGYALHGTYWHNNFGNPMSHGCVNMPSPEAEWFFNWTSIGTPVHVQYF